MITQLPEQTDHSCVVRINQTLLLFIGGISFSLGTEKRTFFFDGVNNVFTPGPNLNFARNFLSCGVLTQLNESTCELERFVVVAGGQNQNSVVLNSTEILPLADLQSAAFELGPDLPVRKVGAQMVEFDSSVILVGGFNPSTSFTSTLYQLKSVGGPWVLMNQTLQVRRGFHTAFLVPEEFTNCN